MFKLFIPIIPLAFIGSLNAASFSATGPAETAIDVTSPGKSVTLNVTDTGKISDLNVAIHLYNARNFPLDPQIDGTMAWGDLNVVLKKGNIEVNLYFDGPPGETSDLFIVLDDEATINNNLNEILDAGDVNVETQAPAAFTSGQSGIPIDTNSIAASYLPSCSLEAFTGEELSGTWTLTFSDDVVPFESDYLLGWQLFGDTDEAAVVMQVDNCDVSILDNTPEPQDNNNASDDDDDGAGSLSLWFLIGISGLTLYRRLKFGSKPV